jgi:HTH-type transcriptional regulator/antitoxin HipB
MPKATYTAAMDYRIQSPGQLSSHLRALRKTAGLSQQQLGALIGVGQTRIARIEADPSSISTDQLLSILSALGVQVILRAPEEAGKAAAAPKRSARARTGRRTPDEPW